MAAFLRLTPSPRRMRHIRLLSLRWQRRALFVLGGIAVGLAAVGMALAADRCGALFHAVLDWQPHAALLLTPGGFALSSFLARRFFPNSGGSGIPQAIAARQLHGTAARQRLVSLRTAGGKTGLLLLGLLCGASIGREGPTVQVGAALMFALGRLSPRRQAVPLPAAAPGGALTPTAVDVDLRLPRRCEPLLRRGTGGRQSRALASAALDCRIASFPATTGQGQGQARVKDGRCQCRLMTLQVPAMGMIGLVSF